MFTFSFNVKKKFSLARFVSLSCRICQCCCFIIVWCLICALALFGYLCLAFAPQDTKFIIMICAAAGLEADSSNWQSTTL